MERCKAKGKITVGTSYHAVHLWRYERNPFNPYKQKQDNIQNIQHLENHKIASSLTYALGLMLIMQIALTMLHNIRSIQCAYVHQREAPWECPRIPLHKVIEFGHGTKGVTKIQKCVPKNQKFKSLSMNPFIPSVNQFPNNPYLYMSQTPQS